MVASTAANSTYLPDTGFWRGKKVLVTGGSGFLGRQICARLAHYGAEVVAPRRKEYDFTRMDDATRCLATHKPEIVIHSAAYYGGLGITLAEPGTIYYQNLIMGAHLMEASRVNGVQKFVGVGTACSYPGQLEDKMREADLWSGPLHDSVMAYGSVKKMMAIQGMAYRKQFGFNSIHLVCANLYGPNDCFDDYRSHVVGALIRKFYDAHVSRQPVSVWGSGKPVREFLYVEDCADGIVLAAEKYDESEPLNIGTGVSTTIRDLVETITHCLGFGNEVVWDRSKPDGQLKKTLDVTRMQAALNWVPRMSLRDGVEKTMKWYAENVGKKPMPARRVA